MLELFGLFVASILHELLAASYVIGLGDGRRVVASVLSGLIAMINIGLFVTVAESDQKLAGIAVVGGAHMIAAYIVVRFAPRRNPYGSEGEGVSNVNQ